MKENGNVIPSGYGIQDVPSKQRQRSFSSHSKPAIRESGIASSPRRSPRRTYSQEKEKDKRSSNVLQNDVSLTSAPKLKPPTTSSVLHSPRYSRGKSQESDSPRKLRKSRSPERDTKGESVKQILRNSELKPRSSVKRLSRESTPRSSLRQSIKAQDSATGTPKIDEQKNGNPNSKPLLGRNFVADQNSSIGTPRSSNDNKFRSSSPLKKDNLKMTNHSNNTDNNSNNTETSLQEMEEHITFRIDTSSSEAENGNDEEEEEEESSDDSMNISSSSDDEPEFNRAKTHQEDEEEYIPEIGVDVELDNDEAHFTGKNVFQSSSSPFGSSADGKRRSRKRKISTVNKDFPSLTVEMSPEKKKKRLAMVKQRMEEALNHPTSEFETPKTRKMDMFPSSPSGMNSSRRNTPLDQPKFEDESLNLATALKSNARQKWAFDDSSPPHGDFFTPVPTNDRKSFVSFSEDGESFYGNDDNKTVLNNSTPKSSLEVSSNKLSTGQRKSYIPAIATIQTPSLVQRRSFMPPINSLRVSKQFAAQLQPLQSSMVFNSGVKKETNPKPNVSSPSISDRDGESTIFISQKNTPMNTDRETSDESDKEADQTFESLGESDHESELNRLKDEIMNEKEKIKLEEERNNEVALFDETPDYGYVLTGTITWVLIVSLAFYSWFWRSERFRIGYCGIEPQSTEPTLRTTSSFMNSILDSVTPSCVQCPSHSICLENFDVICDPDYLYYESSWAFGGFLPIAPRCLPDTEKESRIQAILNRAKTILRKNNSNVKCGHGTTSEAGIFENDLKNILKKKKKSSLEDGEFDQLWDKAINYLETESEISFEQVIARTNSSGENNQTLTKVIRSTSFANLSAYCRCKNLVTELCFKYRKTVLGLLLLISSYIYIKFKITNYRILEGESTRFVRIVISRLAKQHVDSDKDSRGFTERYIAVSQLRDILLFDDGNQGEGFRKVNKDTLWEKVCKSVEGNSNVRARQMEVNGEIMRVWEWVGDASLFDNSNSKKQDMNQNTKAARGNNIDEKVGDDSELEQLRKAMRMK